jgi:hypothetical protein
MLHIPVYNKRPPSQYRAVTSKSIFSTSINLLKFELPSLSNCEISVSSGMYESCRCYSFGYHGGARTPRWRWWVSNMAAIRIFGSACWHGRAKVVCVTTYTRPLEPKQYVYVTCKTAKLVGSKCENGAGIEFLFL